MVTLLIILVGFALLSILLWGVICTSVLLLVHKLKGLSKQEWIQTLIAYIKERSRRQVFFAFLAAETTIAGGLIPLAGNGAGGSKFINIFLLGHIYCRRSIKACL